MHAAAAAAGKKEFSISRRHLPPATALLRAPGAFPLPRPPPHRVDRIVSLTLLVLLLRELLTQRGLVGLQLGLVLLERRCVDVLRDRRPHRGRDFV